jgi:hypothetical protein
MHQVKKEWRTSGEKYMGKKFNIIERRAEYKNQYQQNPSMEWSPICAKEVAEALRTTLNWKAPGRDHIPNFG